MAKHTIKAIGRVAQDAGWQADTYRRFCLGTHNQAYRNTATTTALANAVILWRTDPPRTVHLGMLWEIEAWDEGMLQERIQTLTCSRVEEQSAIH